MNKKGFTLIELLIVIMILGVLAALITGNFFTSLKKGRDAKRKADLEQITRALEMYYEDKRAYPSSSDVSFGSVLTDLDSGKIYMQKLPNDPNSGSYGYETDATGTYYKLYACLENTLQILPYTSSPSTFTCSKNCKNQVDTTVPCIWGISSSNTTP